MSNLTRIIVIGSPLLSGEFMEQVNKYLTELNVGTFNRVDKYVGGNRPFVEDVWMGCFNYLPLLDLLNRFVHLARDEFSLVIQREHDNEPWMCRIRREIFPIIPKEVGV